MSEFQGKVAIVTGGTSGIGRAAAVAYAREGARVVVAGRRAAEGEEHGRFLRAPGGEGIFGTTDGSKAAQGKELVERTMQTFGRLDFAFNNAGIEQEPTPFLEQNEETYDRVMDINVKGVWLSMNDEITAMHPIGRMGKSEESADPAIWLSSSKSSFVTGHSLLVDGGFTAQ